MDAPTPKTAAHDLRSRDPDKLSAAMNAVKEMLAGLNVAR